MFPIKYAVIELLLFSGSSSFHILDPLVACDAY